jgi:hypothetical protein
MNVHSFIGMVVDAKRPEEDIEDGGPGGAESPRYEAGMLRRSREFAITGADAGTPHGRQQKGWSWTRTRTPWLNAVKAVGKIKLKTCCLIRSERNSRIAIRREHVTVLPLQCLYTYMTIKHNKNTLMGYRHSVVLCACMMKG